MKDQVTQLIKQATQNEQIMKDKINKLEREAEDNNKIQEQLNMAWWNPVRTTYYTKKD